MFTTTKTFTHEVGLSCCFRQWRAKSHCAQLHGYALAVELQFESDELDENNWVIDFGSFGPVKEWLRSQFDHTLVVAKDDPQMKLFEQMHRSQLCNLVVLPSVGCEAFAAHIASHVQEWIRPRVVHSFRGLRLRRVTVREHGGNACGYEP